MQRLLTAVLLLIFAASAPFGAEALRFCLLENRFIISAVEECSVSAKVDKCCDDCDADGVKHDGTTCCLEVKKLPDSSLPAGPERVPAFYAVEIPEEIFVAVIPVVELDAAGPYLPAELMALPPPASRRAMLGVWTI